MILIYGFLNKKKELMKQTVMYCDACQKLKHIILTSGAETHVLLMKTHVDYSYSYGTIMKVNGSHLLHADVNEMKTLYRSQRRSLPLVSV